MKLNEFETGDIFCIEGTKSYPKLRLDVGYVDIRDEIRSVHELKNYDCDLMTKEEVEKEFSKYEMNTDDIENLKKDLIERFN